MRLLKVFFYVMFVLVLILHAQDFNEADLFSDTSSITQAPLSSADSVYEEEKNLGISGIMTSAFNVSMPYKNLNTPMSQTSITADVLMDARLKGGIKGFVSGEAIYSPKTDSMGISSAKFLLPEAFIDMNFRNKIYLRTGKQVLQWGRGYLWNPTDLINVERKSFVQKIGLREGAYGIKAHVPFGTRLNLYGFLDFRGADSLENTGVSFKTEFTVNSTEMAFAVWSKKGKKPVLGYDFSSSLSRYNIAGEVSFFRKDNEVFVELSNNSLSIIKGKEEWATRAALNISRSFNVNGIPDRLTIIAEGFYNSTGYSSSFIIDAANATVALPLPNDTLNPIMFVAANGLLRSNEISKYYIALFSTFSRFINSNMSLSLNAIGNIEQSCAMLYGSITYSDLRDLSLGLTISGGVGPDNTEYTLDLGAGSPFRSGINTRLSAAISF